MATTPEQFPLIANLEDLKQALEILRDAGVAFARVDGNEFRFAAPELEPEAVVAQPAPSTPRAPDDSAAPTRPGYSQLFGAHPPSFVAPPQRKD